MISVCMASYNGASYVGEQLRSILAQLGAGDEVVVADDASTDNTVDTIRALGDDRVRVLTLPRNVGHVRAFEAALREAVGDVVLLSDQDDVWIPGRVQTLLDALESSPIVASNWRLIGGADHDGPHFTDEAASTAPKLANVGRILLGRLPYFGCAMGIRRDAMPQVLPFPRATEAHDLWIAMVGNMSGGMAHLGASTVERRIHETNLTPRSRRSIGPVLLTRVGMVQLAAIAVARVARARRGSA
jgi:glycosyltransferase involved in cell wall biosynthesis